MFTARRFWLLVLIALVALVACGGDDGDGDAAKTTTTTTAPTTTTTTADAGEAPPPPERWVAVDESGQLVVPGGDTDGADRVLVALDHPEECPPPGEPVAACQWITAVALSPDGADVYYETCCEPAPGTIFRVGIEGGEAEMVAHGGFPAIDPGGERLAMVELQWVTVHDLDGGDEPRRFDVGEDARMPAALHGMTWSPDGSQIAFAVFERTDEPARVHTLDLTEADSLDDARPVAGQGERSWTYPSFRYDGAIAVAEQDLVLPEDPTGPARVLVVDPDDGRIVDELAVDAGVLSLDHDSSGRHLLHVLDDGSVHWWSGDGTGTLAESGYLAASW